MMPHELSQADVVHECTNAARYRIRTSRQNQTQHGCMLTMLCRIVYSDDFDFTGVATQSLGNAIGNSMFSTEEERVARQAAQASRQDAQIESELDVIQTMPGNENMTRAQAEEKWANEHPLSEREQLSLQYDDEFVRDRLLSNSETLKTYRALVESGKSSEDALVIADGVHSLSTDKDKLDIYTQAQKELVGRKGWQEGDVIEGAYDASQFVDTKRRVDGINLLMESGKVTGNDLVRLKQESQLLTASILAKDAYFDSSLQGILPDGIKRVDSFSKSEIGFFAALYNNTTGNGGTSNILAFRGTEAGNAAKVDWGNNIWQQSGFDAEQFNTSVNLSENLFKKAKGDLSFVGHSLGGGLAAAAALVNDGGQAITFNAEGLSHVTIKNLKLDVSQASNITALNVEGELLTMAQSGVVRGIINTIGTPVVNSVALGKTVYQLFNGNSPTMEGYSLAPMGAARGVSVETPAVNTQGNLLRQDEQLFNALNLHSMNSVKNSLHYLMDMNGGHLPDKYLQSIQVRNY